MFPMQHDAPADFARGKSRLSVKRASASMSGSVIRLVVEGVIRHHIVTNGRPFFGKRMAPKTAQDIEYGRESHGKPSRHK